MGYVQLSYKFIYMKNKEIAIAKAFREVNGMASLINSMDTYSKLDDYKRKLLCEGKPAYRLAPQRLKRNRIIVNN